MSSKENKIFNILFCGIGGQGVLKASEVAGVAAVNSGYHVKKSEVHGMAQRGGSVESHLRFGTQVYSPIIQPGEADFLVSFYADESKRLAYFLKKDGVDLTRFLADAEKLPDARFINTFFLGILAAYLPMSAETWLTALQTVVAKRMDENKKIFMDGLEIGKKEMK
jgi:indolepyruvate ferredoxin oxidoreductase, beta subunit